MDQASAGTLPIHRVRFDAPATLTFSGYAEVFAMAVTSLSVHGVGCSGPEGLVLGDRLQLAFSLAPEEPASDFPCEVIWVEPADEGTALYGMRFVGLSPEREQRLSGLLAERGGQCPPMGATAERRTSSPAATSDDSAPLDADTEASFEGFALDAGPKLRHEELEAAAGHKLSDLATYGLEGERLSTWEGAPPHRATDLDAAIVEQTRRPMARMPLSSAVPLDDIESVGALAESCGQQRRQLQAARRSVWTAAVVGFALGAALALAGVSLMGISEPPPPAQSAAP